MTKHAVSPPPRERNGRHTRQPRPETEAEIKAVALSHPHRQGNTHQWLSSAAGRFIFASWGEDYGRPYYAACEGYQKLVLAWSKDKGVPVQVRLSFGNGAPPPMAVVEARHADKVRIEQQLGTDAEKILRRIIMDDVDPPSVDWVSVRLAIHALAVAMGHVARKDHPFR